jgi:hypothetical protein
MLTSLTSWKRRTPPAVPVRATLADDRRFDSEPAKADEGRGLCRSQSKTGRRRHRRTQKDRQSGALAAAQTFRAGIAPLVAVLVGPQTGQRNWSGAGSSSRPLKASPRSWRSARRTDSVASDGPITLTSIPVDGGKRWTASLLRSWNSRSCARRDRPSIVMTFKRAVAASALIVVVAAVLIVFTNAEGVRTRILTRVFRTYNRQP